jgi:hypothetical protein
MRDQTIAVMGLFHEVNPGNIIVIVEFVEVFIIKDLLWILRLMTLSPP